MIKKANAFTIVELLIVIVVIAILAAISIVAYRGIQDRANESAASAKANQAAKKILVYYAENETYPDALTDADITDTTGLQYKRDNNSTPKTYCITATNGNKSYYINNTTSTSPTVGGCSGHGQGGIAAITNLVPNPSAEINTTGLAYRYFGDGGGAGTNTRPTTGGFSGTAFLRKTWTSTPTAGGAVDTGFNTAIFPASAGTNYRASCYVRTNRSDVRGVVYVNWLNSSNGGISSSWGSNSLLPANTWTRISASGVSPAGTAGARLICATSNSVSWQPSDTIDGDAFMFTEGAVLYGYADGESPSWDWNGTPHNSASTGPAL